MNRTEGAPAQTALRSHTADWCIGPAVQSLGLWLSRVKDDGTSEVVAPPGVALAATTGARTNRWRHAQWLSADHFYMGREPDHSSEFSTVGAALDYLPPEFRDWILEATEQHIQALERGGRLRAGDPRPQASSRANALLDRAAAERADVSAVREGGLHFPVLQRELARLTEAASTARGVADSLIALDLAPAEVRTVQATIIDFSDSVVRVTIDLQQARDNLARELSLAQRDSQQYRIAMASRSWRLTQPFRWIGTRVRAATGHFSTHTFGDRHPARA